MTDLSERLDRLARDATQGLIALPLEAAGRLRQRRRRQLGGAALSLLAAVVAVLVIANASAKTTTVRVISPPPTSPQTTAPPTALPGHAIVTVHLYRTEVPAGTPIDGVATVDNRTGHPITYTNACGPDLAVGLANAETSFNPAFTLPGCFPAFSYPVGVSHFPISVTTTFQGCTNTPSETSSSVPLCSNINLPVGVYHTAIVAPSPIEPVDPVTVILTSPAGIHAPQAPATRPGDASVSVSLNETDVPAGTPISGTVTFNNRTGRPIPVPNAPGCTMGSIVAGLVSDHLDETPPTAGTACATNQLAVGVSQYPITISTTYLNCTPVGSTPTNNAPLCLDAWPQGAPLPPGSYRVAIAVPTQITVFDTVTVHLNPS